ncbi:hypothetical protein ACA910_003336 [Epithemia clementina (nom. ined.)]
MTIAAPYVAHPTVPKHQPPHQAFVSSSSSAFAAATPALGSAAPSSIGTMPRPVTAAAAAAATAAADPLGVVAAAAALPKPADHHNTTTNDNTGHMSFVELVHRVLNHSPDEQEQLMHLVLATRLAQVLSSPS